jgi:dTDP-4-amino-4,6-dideoxygalactose transaminase
MIPMVDLKIQYSDLKSEIDSAVLEVLSATQFILGPNVKMLESEIGEYLGAPHALSCGSGTDALHLAMRAANIGPGDEIITTAFTFIATAEAIAYVGATPVFVDIDPFTFNIDPSALAAAITPRTKAVVVVHLFGLPCPLDMVERVCIDNNLILIEDCAQSFGARHNGRTTGTVGHLGCFSFFPSKNLGGCGDGGMITTADDKMAQKILSLRNHGSHVRYYHDSIGYNSRLDEIQAAILRVKLRHIERFNRERLRVARSYNKALHGLAVQTPLEQPNSSHVFHQYTILCEDRAKVVECLTKADIASAIYYPVPLHRQKAFGERFRSLSLPNTEWVTERCLSLPIFPEMSESQVDRVAEVISAAVR